MQRDETVTWLDPYLCKVYQHSSEFYVPNTYVVDDICVNVFEPFNDKQHQVTKMWSWDFEYLVNPELYDKVFAHVYRKWTQMTCAFELAAITDVTNPTRDAERITSKFGLILNNDSARFDTSELPNTLLLHVNTDPWQIAIAVKTCNLQKQLRQDVHGLRFYIAKRKVDQSVEKFPDPPPITHDLPATF